MGYVLTDVPAAGKGIAVTVNVLANICRLITEKSRLFLGNLLETLF